MNLNLRANTCDPDRLESFLSGKLSDAQEREFMLHLNTCEDCRRSLERQAAEPQAWMEAEKLLKPSRFDSRSADEASESAAAQRSTREPLAIQTVLAALGPTDDPQMLGRLGGYEVSGVVGAGGMGVVLKAIDKSLDRTVAIKVLAPHLAASGAARKRFAREAKAAAAVLHPNVMAIHSVSNDEALPYLVMPYVRGQSLQKRLDEEGPLPIQEILRIGSQIAAGLAAAHAQGLVHRDIKPANILMEEGVERVTITDFGLARAVDDATITKSGMIAGTPQYMSPQQARGESVDGRSDLFSLGSVLYAACTGRPPFRAETSYGVLRRITDDEPTSIREINPDIPDWLCAIIARLMSKRPEDRFESAQEVAELLETCLAHVQQPTAVPLPASLVPAATKSRFSSRTKLPLGVLAMIAALSLGLLGIFVWQSADPPDISGRWSGEGWGQVVLEKKEGDAYVGTYSDTFGKDVGKLQLKWSRIEHRFKGTWQEGQDRFGKISVRLVDDQIRGAWTADNDSRIQPGTPELADLLWSRAENPRLRSTVERSREAATQQPRPAVGAAEPPRAPTPPRVGDPAAEPDPSPQRGSAWGFKERRFSETRELVLSAGSLAFMLDLDTGKTMDMPAMAGRPEQRQMDVHPTQDQPAHYPRGLTGLSLTGVKVKSSEWNASPDEVLSGMVGGDVRPLKKMDYDPMEPATYFFLTRGGTLGILELLALADDPKGIRIRYKTVEPAAQKQPQKADAGGPADETRPIQGAVLDVQDQELVEISLGIDDGLRPGITLTIFRDDVYLGKITVLRVEADKSAGRIESRTGVIRRGDRVSPEAHAVRTNSLTSDNEADNDRTDNDRLQGTWEFAAWTQGGKTIKREDLGEKDARPKTLRFIGDKLLTVMVNTGGKEVEFKYGFTLDPSRKPKEIDLTPEGENKGKRGPAIYELDGDSLRVCFAGQPDQERPTRLESKEGDSYLLLTYKRVAEAVKPLGSQPKTKATPKRLNYFTTGHSIRIACSADGKLIAVANGNPTRILQEGGTSRVKGNWKPTADILDAETGKIVVSLKLTTGDEDAVLAATQRISHIEATALAFSAAGNVVAVGTSVGQVKLYSAPTGELVRSLDDEPAKLADKETPENWKSMKRAMGSVQGLAFSPDGSLLATCGSSFGDFSDVFDGVTRLTHKTTGPGRLKVWDVEAGTLKHDLVGHSYADAVSFSPDGNWLASAGRWAGVSENGTGVKIWNAQTGEELRTIPTNANYGTHAVVFSPIKKIDGPARHDDLKPWDGLHVAIGSGHYDKENDTSTTSVSLTYALSGITEWQRTISGHASPKAFSPDGKSVLVLSGQSIQFLDAATGTVNREIKSDNLSKDGRWNDFAIAPQANTLVIGAVDEQEGSVEVWDLGPGPAANSQSPPKATKAMPKRLHHFTISDNVKTIAMSADGKLVAIANSSPTFPLQLPPDWKRSVDILDAETGQSILSLDLTAEGLPRFEEVPLAFSPDGGVLAVGTGMGQVKLIKPRTGELVLALDDEKAKLAREPWTEPWLGKLAEKKTPANLKSLKRAMGTVGSLAFSPDGSLLAMTGLSFEEVSRTWDDKHWLPGDGPGRLKVWDVKTGELKYDLAGHRRANAVAFSADGSLLASAGSSLVRGYENSAIIWDPATGEKLRSISIEATSGITGAHAVAFSPSSKMVVIGSRNFGKETDISSTTVSVVYALSGITQWQQTIPGLADPITFSPDGKSIAILCGGQSIRFVETESGKLLHEIKAADFSQGGLWTDFAIAPQAKKLAIGGVDGARTGSVEVWDFDGPGPADKSAPAKDGENQDGQ